MSYVIADPEMMTAAATDLATIGSNVSVAHAAAAAPTVAVIPAAADKVSASIAQLFSQHAADYQARAARAAAFHEQFVQNLTAGAFSYASTEATIASLLPILPDFPATIASLLPILPNFPATIAGSLQDLLNLPAELVARYLVVPNLYRFLLLQYPPSFLPLDWQIALYGTAV
jgi:hypothetical protein